MHIGVTEISSMKKPDQRTTKNPLRKQSRLLTRHTRINTLNKRTDSIPVKGLSSTNILVAVVD